MKFSSFLIQFLLFCISTSAFAQKFHFTSGLYFGAYMCNDKSLFTWGDNYYGQLGRDETNCLYTEACKAEYVENIVSIDAGLGSHCLALTANNKIISWGQNYYGELGAGKTCSGGGAILCQRQKTDTVLGGQTGTFYLENVKAIATGQSQSYALLKTGEVVAWGNNSFGQLGDGTYIDRAAPIYVKLNATTRLSGITMIAAGGSHAYALTEDGHVYSWGSNIKNQLACGDEGIHQYPTKVVDKDGNWISGVKSIDAGLNFGLLLLHNKRVYGLGAYKGTDFNLKLLTIYRVLPYAELVLGGSTNSHYLENITSISAGYDHSLAIYDNGTTKNVVAWGNNKFPNLESDNGGQIGTGNTEIIQYLSPNFVLQENKELIKNAAYIWAGTGSSFIEAFDENNENVFYTCGANINSQLGNNDFNDKYYAIQIQQNLCSPICSAFNIKDEYKFCKPFEELIKTNLSTTSFSFKWYKDSELLSSENKDSILVSEVGTYTVKISDNESICLTQTKDIEVVENQINYQTINGSFCNSNIEFKVVGTGNFNWYNKKGGYLLGKGNYLNTSKLFTEEIIADSIYQVWLEHEDNCQAMPLKSIRNCNCNALPPICFDTIACYNRDYYVRALGDSVIWYKDNKLEEPLFIGNFYSPKKTTLGEYSLFATNMNNRCESTADSSIVLVEFCEQWYTVSGTVTADNEAVAYTRVILHDSHTLESIDSCITGSDGSFLLFSDKDSVTLYAQSNNTNYFNTWIGNKKDASKAFHVYVDAYIGGLKIALIPVGTQVTEVFNNKEFKNASVYSLSGTLLGSCTHDDVCFRSLLKSKGMYLVVFEYINGSKESKVIQNF